CQQENASSGKGAAEGDQVDPGDESGQRQPHGFQENSSETAAGKKTSEEQQEEALTMKSKFLFGFHAVTSRLRHDASSVEEIYVDAQRHDKRMQDLVRAAQAAKVRIIHADDQRLSSMS